jgi:hypothetical protein
MKFFKWLSSFRKKATMIRFEIIGHGGGGCKCDGKGPHCKGNVLGVDYASVPITLSIYRSGSHCGAKKE